MTVREDTDSRKFHQTNEGTTITVSYTCTREEWDAGHASLPYIGRIYHPDWPSVRCSDVKAEPVAKNECRVIAVFSTTSTAFRQKREDHAASWQERISINMVEQPVDGWWAYGDDISDQKSFRVWKTQWKNNKPPGAPDNAPECIQLKPRTVMTLTAYGTTEYFQRILSNIGSINNMNFLFDHLQISKYPKVEHDVVTSFIDKTKWMFIGSDMEPIRQNCWRYQFQFLYNPEGWNVQSGVSTDMYGSFNMGGLLAGMSKISDDFGGEYA